MTWVLTRKKCDPSLKTEITSWKANWNKSWSLIPIQSNIKGWNWKKYQLNKDKKTQVNWVNLRNLRLESWDRDNPYKKKLWSLILDQPNIDR
jgi:hypothetical protein